MAGQVFIRVFVVSSIVGLISVLLRYWIDNASVAQMDSATDF